MGPSRGSTSPSTRFRSASANRPGVETLEFDEVKAEEGRGESGSGSGDVAAIGKPPVLLQQLEARRSIVVEGHDLSIDDELIEGKASDCRSNLGEDGRGVVPAAVPQNHRAATLGGDESVAVVLDLEQPVGVAERRVGCLCEHHIQIRVADFSLGRSGFDQVVPEPLPSVAAFPEVLYGKTGEDRLFVELAFPLTVPAVGLLDEQPLGRALLHLYERPLSVELVARKREQEFPLRHAVVGILIPRQGAPVPHDHLSAAVFVGGDDAFEVRVSRGWSSVCAANRFTEGSMDTPAGTAHDIKTPSCSTLRS